MCNSICLCPWLGSGILLCNSCRVLEGSGVLLCNSCHVLEGSGVLPCNSCLVLEGSGVFLCNSCQVLEGRVLPCHSYRVLEELEFSCATLAMTLKDLEFLLVLLERCLKGATQNRNESLTSYCPRHQRPSTVRLPPLRLLSATPPSSLTVEQWP